MPKAKPPSPRERETQLLNQLGSHGLAAIGLLLNFFRAMQKKGHFQHDRTRGDFRCDC